MLKERYVFAQLVKFLDRNHFNYVCICRDQSRVISKSTVCGTVLQVDQAASADKEVLENISEYCPHSNLFCHNYLLSRAIVQHDMNLERSIYEVLQILGITLTDKTHLKDLFDKSNFKNVNVLYGSSEPNLFNY